MRLIPVIKRLEHLRHVLPITLSKAKLMEINTISQTLKLRKQPMEDDRVGHRQNEQHPYRRKTHLALPADVVTDEVSRAKQQLPHTIQNRTRASTQAPNVHHALPNAVPPDAPHASTLRARRAIMPREGEPAVAAAVLLLTLDISYWLTLPMPETSV